MKLIFRNFLFFLLLAGIGSCGNSESQKESAEEKSMNGEDLASYYQNLIDIGLSKNSAWNAHWAAQVGTINSSEFALVATDSIDPMEMPEANPISTSDPLFPYQFPHPEGNGTIDIYLYKVEAQESLEKPFLNPDSEVIWFRADGMKERLLFMGPSGMFEEGAWLNAQEFLVLGYFQEEDGFHPMVWIIDVGNHVFRQFRFPKSAKEYPPVSYLDQKLKSVNLS